MPRPRLAAGRAAPAAAQMNLQELPAAPLHPLPPSQRLGSKVLLKTYPPLVSFPTQLCCGREDLGSGRSSHNPCLRSNKRSSPPRHFSPGLPFLCHSVLPAALTHPSSSPSVPCGREVSEELVHSWAATVAESSFSPWIFRAP